VVHADLSDIKLEREGGGEGGWEGGMEDESECNCDVVGRIRREPSRGKKNKVVKEG